MWQHVKRWFGIGVGADNAATSFDQYDFKWHEIGPDNPFGVRFLDVRPLTWNVVAATKEQRIAESFSRQRQTDGREFISAEITDSTTIACDLRIPHNGQPLEGIVFKSDAMEVKWDIYVYESVFLFVRSWTGELQYRAFAKIGSDSIQIARVETSRGNVETASQTVFFLLGTHAMRRVLPHPIPSFIPSDPKSIALLSFSMFGKLACYATYEDFTRIPITTANSV